MKHIINHRISSLREWMKRKDLAAFIIPSADPHLSEYVAPRWKSREWISGFNGSAGTVVVTQHEAGLWTDSRYFIQAAEQLEGTGISLYKEMLPETPSIPAFISASIPAGSTVGIDGKLFSAAAVEEWQHAFSAAQLTIQTEYDPMDELWEDRPSIPQSPAFIYDIQHAGKTCIEKVEEIRHILTSRGAESLFLTALDEIAWVLNLRGNDIKCNPVVISYLLITTHHTTCFIEPQKLTAEVRQYLASQHIEVEAYSRTAHHLSHATTGTIWVDPERTNYTMLASINPDCTIIYDASPVALLKAIRNPQEIDGIHNAMKKDGVALAKFFKWLDEVVPTGKETELSIDKKLHKFRTEQALYMGESFDTIAGYGAHGAIVHYSATAESCSTLHPKGFLLLDSGAQYMDGTTDITRTIALGELTQEEKEDYTLVLKGHVALAMAKFPAGTRGAQLDVLARMPLWTRGMNFLHGTGHGIGHFLNVHEGPQSIRMNENPIVLQPGMVTSNEPGVYKADSHGIRIENLLLTTPCQKGMYGEYLCFETITLCPICTKGIIKEMLTKEEVEWLNSYHATVYRSLLDSLNEEEKRWLEQATRSI